MSTPLQKTALFAAGNQHKFTIKEIHQHFIIAEIRCAEVHHG
jgi:hypothetical protein